MQMLEKCVVLTQQQVTYFSVHMHANIHLKCASDLHILPHKLHACRRLYWWDPHSLHQSFSPKPPESMPWAKLAAEIPALLLQKEEKHWIPEDHKRELMWSEFFFWWEGESMNTESVLCPILWKKNHVLEKRKNSVKKRCSRKMICSRFKIIFRIMHQQQTTHSLFKNKNTKVYVAFCFLGSLSYHSNTTQIWHLSKGHLFQDPAGHFGSAFRFSHEDQRKKIC